MGQTERTVFISYRRANESHAKAIYHTLMAHQLDCFLSLGAPDPANLNQIRERMYFLLILTPSALADDVLRLEIQTAIESGRKIVTLMLDGFGYDDPAVQPYLTDTLASLANQPAIDFPRGFFDDGMSRLIQYHLNPMATSEVINKLVHDLVSATEAKLPSETELRAGDYFDRAFKKFEAGDYVGAIDDYTQAVRLAPDDYVAWYNLGLARWNLRQNAEAIEDYTEAIRLKPDYAKAFYNRAIVRGALRDFQGEIDDYTETIRLDPNYHQAYNNRAATYIDLKQYDLAIMDANQAIRLKDDYTDAYYNRGLAKKNNGDVAGALADYDKALALNPNYNKAYRSRGIIYEERGDLLLAKADYERYIQLGGIEPDKIRTWIAEIDEKLATGTSGVSDPNKETASAMFNRAFKKHEDGDFRGSIGDYTIVLELTPNDHLAWYNRGLGYYNLGENDKADADYSACIRLNPNYINAYYNRGLARKRRGDGAGALADYNETIRRNPNYTNAYRARGIIYEDRGEWDKAKADYMRYLELGGLEPEKIMGWIREIEDKMARIPITGELPMMDADGMTAKNYFDRAYDKHEAGDYEGAIADYTESLKLNPHDHLAWYNRGLGYYNLNQHAQAISDYSECIRINPDYVNAYYNRGLARNKQADKTGALMDYIETIRRKADYVNAYRARGIIYEDIEDYDRALADYTRYLELGGSEADKIRGWINEIHAKRIANIGTVSDATGMTASQYFDRAFSKHESGDYTGAVADYTESLKLNPHDHLAWYNRGLGYYFLGQHSQAISDYTECIRLNPEYINAYYNRGLAKNKLGDKSGAMDDYNQTIRRKDDYTNAYRARGILYEELGDFTRAVGDYNRYIELGGEDAEKVRGWIEALKQKVNTGASPKPSTPNPFEHINFTDTMFKPADAPPSEDSRYVDEDGKIRWTKMTTSTVAGGQLTHRQYFDRAYHKHEKNDFAGAIADYSEALRLNPKDHLAWYNRGLGYYNLNQHAQAIKDYSECIRLNPGYINAYYNRGLARNKNGDRAGALADYNETIRRKPDYVNAYRARGIIYEDNGDYAKAIADYTRYLELGGSEADKIKGWIREVEDKMRVG
jgi:tetratricopeptide (TPR) repeat protein